MQEDNVKVAVRVRPLLPKEKLGAEQVCVRLVPNSNQVVVGKDRAFTFDFALPPKATQEDTYKQCVEPLVKSIFEGYNSTVFAYGQTGSGKTYTIGGGDISSLTEDEYGIIPRALQQMFDIMKANSHVTYTVHVSYIEIYKEELRDLLDLNTSNKDLCVREDDKGNTVMSGHRVEEVHCLDEVMSLLESGSAARHTGSTQMNEHSSRSHSVFTVLIGQQWSDADPMAERRVCDSLDEPNDKISHFMFGKFHFVDLAGSERAHRTGNVGDRFKESIHINSGLLSLGNVISSLGDPKKKCNHIPYRESKITRILKDSLGGNAKTVMICCISPASSNFDETLNALKYANRARNIKNKPVINRDLQSIRLEEMKSEIMALKEELKRRNTNEQSGCSESSPDQSASYIRELEQKVSRLETECAHYCVMANEVFKHLTEIQSQDTLSLSHDAHVRDCLELMEKIMNEVPATRSMEYLQNETIKDLQSQLNKCHSDLKSDEEIFTDKAREMIRLTEQLQEMEQRDQENAIVIRELQNQVQQQEQQLVQQQIRIQELEASLKVSTLSDSNVMDSSIVSSIPLSSSWRPKSVPAHLYSTPDNGAQLRPPSRHTKTSPAVFSVDRVMQSFRARSQLLVTRLEDSDEVLHQTFSEDKEEAAPPPLNALQRRGTYRLKKNKKGKEGTQPFAQTSELKTQLGELMVSGSAVVDIEETEFGSRLINVDSTSSAELQRKKIKKAQLKMLEANQKVRDLSINIRMKEQLICELVKSGKDAELMNKQYAEKIKALEKEKEQARQEVMEMQMALQDLEAKEQQESAEKEKLQHDYKKKMEVAMQKVTALQRKQKETERVASFAHQHEKKIHDLESAVDRMKQQQELLQKKLKEEAEQKAKLEREMQKEVHRVKELELRNQHQQKVLKRKTEEIAAVQRRLRSNSISSASTAALPPISGEDQDRLEEQRRQLDEEIERVLQERQTMMELQQELKKKEAILAKREAMLAEKSELEMKKMRSSSLLNKERVIVSAQLDSIEHRLSERCQELSEAGADQRPQVKEEVQHLLRKKDMLHSERQTIDSKLQDGKVLSPQEERRLIELEEGMEALDAAIQYKNDSINSKQVELRRSQIMNKSEDNLMNRLNTLTMTETRSLLSRYFDKVISLREAESKLKLQCSEQEVKSEELERVVLELENALHKSALEVDRRLTQQQQEYERKIHMLMHQLMTTDTSVVAGGGGVKGASATTSISTPCLVNGELTASSGAGALNNTSKMQMLEKELYFYRKTSRDLKKKIRECYNNGKLSAELAEEIGVSLVSNSVQSLAEGDPATPRSVHHSTTTGHRLCHLMPDGWINTEEARPAVFAATNFSSNSSPFFPPPHPPATHPLQPLLAAPHATTTTERPTHHLPRIHLGPVVQAPAVRVPRSGYRGGTCASCRKKKCQCAGPT